MAKNPSKSPDELESFEFVVVGSGSVGKSAIVFRFVQKRFISNYDPTIEDMYSKNVNVDEKVCQLQIVDTAGQENYSSLISSWLRGKDAIIFVYDITSRQSFNELDNFYDNTNLLYEDKSPPLILVGNKSDLEKSRQVPIAEAEAKAKGWKASLYIETSAKTGDKVEECFFNAIRAVRAKGGKKKERKEEKSKFCTLL